jgi:hypothetical protein
MISMWTISGEFNGRYSKRCSGSGLSVASDFGIGMVVINVIGGVGKDEEAHHGHEAAFRM